MSHERRKILANGDIQDETIGRNPEHAPRPAHTGWLTQEVRDQLAAAGYYAVPKEAVRIVFAEELVEYLEQIRYGHEPGFADHINRKLAMDIGLELLRGGYLQAHLSEVKEFGDAVLHRVEVTVFKPRTLLLGKE